MTHRWFTVHIGWASFSNATVRSVSFDVRFFPLSAPEMLMLGRLELGLFLGCEVERSFALILSLTHRLQLLCSLRRCQKI